MPSEMKTSATERERIRRIVSMYNKYKMTFEYNLCFFELKRFYQTCTRNTKHEPKAMWTQHWMVLFHWLHCRCFIPLLLLFLLFSLPLSRSLSLSLLFIHFIWTTRNSCCATSAKESCVKIISVLSQFVVFILFSVCFSFHVFFFDFWSSPLRILCAECVCVCICIFFCVV